MANSILDAVEFFERLPVETTKAAQLAINTVSNRGGLTLIRRSILDEIAFPRDYLTGDRLKVAQNATSANLESIIAARHRPTSLARFAASGTSIGSRARIGVRVTVKKGNTQMLKQSWLVRLNNGNIGLAVRVKPGEDIGNRNDPVRVWLSPGVALLYGPSVDQVFRDVAEKVAPPISVMVQREFLRQFARLTS